MKVLQEKEAKDQAYGIRLLIDIQVSFASELNIRNSHSASTFLF